MVSVHGQCLAAAVSETAKRAIESSESMEDRQQPLKVMKSEPGQAAATVRVKLEPGAGLAIAKKLLAGYLYRDITASLLDLGQVLRGCLSVAGNSWPRQLCIGSCGDVQSWRGPRVQQLGWCAVVRKPLGPLVCLQLQGPCVCRVTQQHLLRPCSCLRKALGGARAPCCCGSCFRGLHCSA